MRSCQSKQVRVSRILKLWSKKSSKNISILGVRDALVPLKDEWGAIFMCQNILLALKFLLKVALLKSKKEPYAIRNKIKNNTILSQ